MKADFGGYATKNDIVCSDGLTIRGGAFKHNDKKKVPLVWAHLHDSPDNVLGHAILENRKDGVYAYVSFNGTSKGKVAKELVQHGDVDAMSIYANQLLKQGKDVVHGNIREVSLVLSGANPGALIDSIMIQHGDLPPEQVEDEALIFENIPLEHTDPFEVEDAEDETDPDEESDEDSEEEESEAEEKGDDAAVKHADTKGAKVAVATKKPSSSAADDNETIEDVYNSLSAKQKDVVDFMIGTAVQDKDSSASHSDEDLESIAHSNFQEGFKMARNVFDQNNTKTEVESTVLAHDDLKAIIRDGIKMGSIKESFLMHAEAGDYGITNIDQLFPDAKLVGANPELLARQADWVPLVLNATKHTPFAKVKSITADLTGPEARAKGYIKGNQKVDEVISLLRRTTGPTTIYKKQRLDRDDILDITDIDVIAWLKWEIRFMLNEEIARAILIGDGRSNASNDKIKDPAGAVDGNGIRSILNDDPMYSIQVELPANVSNDDIVDEIVRSRTQYRGSGGPTLYTKDSVLTDLLLLKDKFGRRLYDTVEALAAALRVSSIVPVEVMEELPNVLGIVVNLVDYSVGTNQGGDVTFFQDFDIDVNQEKYLMETRLSGGLTKPKSALVITRDTGTAAVATAPSFDGETNTITIPASTGVTYQIDGEPTTAGAHVITADAEVTATANEGYYFPSNTNTTWSFTFTEA